MLGISIAPWDVRTARDNARASTFAALVIQGGVLGLVLSRFHIGTPAFQAALPWLGAASAVQFWLPERWRLPFFAGFSVIGGLSLVVRWQGATWWQEAAAGAILIALGGAWMAACRVASPRWRILLTVAVALVLSASRSRFDTGILAAVWPILGGAFMFRSISFVVDTVQDAERGSWARGAAYFFMLPALFFPLCPVMRWRSFEQDGPKDAASVVYGRGLRWMARGALQIVCYRALLRHVYVEPGQVLDGATLGLHLLANYGLYLHVSGTFHLIVGALHLFGWSLPESNRQYGLAESFTDYWRRVNIYWKEFILHVVYKPIAFRLRHGGHVRAVMLGSALAFVATWALHGYQNFWVTGAFAFSSRDAVFWGIFAILVVLDARREARDPGRLALNRSVSASDLLRKGGRTALVFAVICLLWSLWSADSWAVWFALWTHVDGVFVAVFGSALILVALAKAALEWAGGGKSTRRLGEQRALAGRPAFAAASIATAALTTALWVASEPAFARLLQVPSVVDELRQPRGGTTWPESVSGGYYERLFAAIGSG